MGVPAIVFDENPGDGSLDVRYLNSLDDKRNFKSNVEDGEDN